MRHHTSAQDLIAAAAAQGFRIEMPTGRRGRCRVIAPDGRAVVMPGPRQRTESRALLNARAALRRIGADV
ncbi:hypothetical protein ACQEV4_42625 [Streptomyces shenzhenensis]|uniref:hypothetical protein n=1 Tax=Streptomyces shenzhenensis TaxID=943815 RepID=UPI003D941D3E